MYLLASAPDGAVGPGVVGGGVVVAIGGGVGSGVVGGGVVTAVVAAGSGMVVEELGAVDVGVTALDSVGSAGCIVSARAVTG